MKFSTYYFHMKMKIMADFQICISVPLTMFVLMFVLMLVLISLLI